MFVNEALNLPLNMQDDYSSFYNKLCWSNVARSSEFYQEKPQVQTYM